MAQLSVAHLQSLIDGAKKLPGLQFETLSRKHERGELANPHRLIEVVRRLETMISVLKSGEKWVEIDGDFSVAATELDRLLTAFEYGQKLPGFDKAGLTFATMGEYAHSLVMLEAASYIDKLNANVEFVEPEHGSATPDIRVYTNDRSWSWHVEVHVPRDLIHPAVGSLTGDRARELVDNTLESKKAQLRAGDSFLLLGGLGCDAETVAVIQRGAAATLAPNRRPRVAGVFIYSANVWTEEYSRDDGQVAARLRTGVRTATVENPGYMGPLRLSAVLPPDAPFQRIE